MYFCSMKHKVTYLLLALLASVSLRAQSVDSCPTMTSKGTDFWVMFLYNNGDQTPHQTTLIAVGDSNATITVSNPSTGWSTTASLTANQSVQITIPLASSTSLQSNTAQTKKLGIHVTSTTSISLYASNYRFKCNDITMVYPTNTLGTHYIMQDYQGDVAHTAVAGAEVGFVATEDNTVLTMTLPCNLLNNTLISGDTLTIDLMQGESYQLIATAPGSFSGMEVSSNGKPFAAFQGNRVAYIPAGSGGADLLYEQAVPTTYWGKEYMVVSTLGRTGDQVRITSSENDCAVYADGALLCTLQKGDSYEDFVTGGSAKHYSGSKKICVGRYLRSYSSGGNPGDPASVILSPVNQGLQIIQFGILSYPDFGSYYINIVAHHSFVSGITLDGYSVSSQFSSTFDTAYSVARISVSPNVHLLESPLGPIMVDCYGLGSQAGYANILGRSFVGYILQDTIEYQDTVCAGHSYNGYGFSISDVETSSDNTLEFWRCETVSSNCVDSVRHYHLSLTVKPTTDTDIVRQIVRGDMLFYNGDTLTAAGIYTFTLTGENGCDSIVKLHVSFMMDTVVYYDTVCQDGVYTGHGFTITSTQTAGSSEYYDSFGDTLRRYCLRLTVLPVTLAETTFFIVMGDTLIYNGDTLTERGDYSYHFTAANGCDSTLVLHLEYEESILTASTDGICPGDSVILNAAGTLSPWWSATPPDTSLVAQQGHTPIVVRPQQTTSYCLFSSEGGDLIDCIVVGVEPPPTLCVELSLPFIDFDSPTVYFTDCSEGGASSTWCFDDGITLNGAYSRRQFNHPLPDSVVVTLQTCNRYHCCADTTFSIHKKIRSIWWPNVFTPDEEQNNRFGCTVTYEIVAFEMHIYNRQGLLVYHTTDPSATWDGTHEGKPCPQGAYVYHWHAKYAYGYVKNGVGTVTLIR